MCLAEIDLSNILQWISRNLFSKFIDTNVIFDPI